MNDINGVELNVGDDIIYTNGNMWSLQKGKVFKITKARVTVKYQEDDAPIYYGNPVKTYISKYHHIITSGEQIMKLG